MATESCYDPVTFVFVANATLHASKAEGDIFLPRKEKRTRRAKTKSTSTRTRVNARFGLSR